jgi:aryl-alcohol dehydrogenase-like predicted oxidoreductase
VNERDIVSHLGSAAIVRLWRCYAPVAAGVNDIDTSDFYGPSVTNQLIKQLLHPYPDDLVIVTKVCYLRGSAKSWLPALSPRELIQAHLRENLAAAMMELSPDAIGQLDEIVKLNQLCKRGRFAPPR